MRILLVEYAVATGMGGTYELEGRAMLKTLLSSFVKSGHQVSYPTAGPIISGGRAIMIRDEKELLDTISTYSSNVDAGLIIAPDHLIADLNAILERNAANLGSPPNVSRLCADKFACTTFLEKVGVPVAEVVTSIDPPEKGCQMYVIKPNSGCGSEGVHMSSFSRTPDGYIATRYVEGLHLSASFIASDDRILPLTINRQLIEMDGFRFNYDGSQVPYNTPRAKDVWRVVLRTAAALGVRGYAGMDLVLGEEPRIVDVNARPTTSIIGISKVMREEIGDLIVRSRFGSLPESVHVEGEYRFRKEDLEDI